MKKISASIALTMIIAAFMGQCTNDAVNPAEKPYLFIMSQNGDSLEDITGGDTILLEWNGAINIDQQFSVCLTSAGEECTDTLEIIDVVSNSDLKSITVRLPQHYSGEGAIKLGNGGNHLFSQTFAINEAVRLLTALPESCVAGDFLELAWSGPLSIDDHLTICLVSADNKCIDTLEVVESIQNDNSCAVRIALPVSFTGQAAIKITNGEKYILSQSISIMKPTLAISVAYREKTTTEYVAGDTLILAWTGAMPKNSDLKALFSKDTGKTWDDTLTILDDTVKSSVARMTLPYTFTWGGTIKLENGEYAVISDQFTVKYLVLLEPNGGDTLYVGDTLIAKWRAFFAVTSVAAKLYPNDFIGEEINITASASVTTSMEEWPTCPWVIKEEAVGDSCLVTITDYNNPSVPESDDVSDSYFVIEPR